jgi:hypothetical protein
MVEVVHTPRWIGWLPVAILPLGVVAVGNRLPAWAFMWALAFVIYAGLKWASWWRARRQTPHAAWRSAAYLVAWPGMDAELFLHTGPPVPLPGLLAWIGAISETLLGAILLWGVARRIPEGQPLVRGWLGMAGLILLLHFGAFKISALFWQRLGVDARPIMDAPLGSTSLSEFWGRRWNLGFHQVAYDMIFAPLYKRLGVGAASFLVFVMSGLVHDLVISLPARGGYGLPTTYFVVQGVGAALERSGFGKRLGLRRGLRGWLFTAAFTAGPAFWLFHPPFVLRVILPFMQAIHAL